MKELELSYYFKEINEFRFKDVFKNCKYPWEALANINKYIREFMDDKNMQINKAEVGEFCSIEGPYFIDEGTEIHAAQYWSRRLCPFCWCDRRRSWQCSDQWQISHCGRH